MQHVTIGRVRAAAQRYRVAGIKEIEPPVPGAGAAGPYHHYTFELFALDTKLDLGPEDARLIVARNARTSCSRKVP